MDYHAVGRDVLEEMWKRNSEGEENGKARQQATSDIFGRARRQEGQK
jgi:hypothetical protein